MISENTRPLINTWLIPYPANTRADYRRHLDQFVAWLGDLEVLDAKRADIQRWLAHLLDDLKSPPSTVRTKSSAISSFYRYLVQENILISSPMEFVRRPKGDSAPKLGLPLDQARHLIADAEEHSRSAAALVWLMMGAGLRVTEACTARIEDLQGDLLTVTVKGGHLHTRPLSPPVLEAVHHAIGDRTNGPIVLNHNHQPLTRQRAWELIERLAGEAGIDNCTPHTLRHTAASLALAAGARIEDVKELLGHRSIETTLRYVRNRQVLDAATNAATHLSGALGSK